MNKVGRNDPCPCGSGKKYKRCCLGHDSAATGFTREERQTSLDKLEEFVSAELGDEDDEAYETFYAAWHDRLDELEERDEQWLELSTSVYDMWFFLDCELADGRRAVDLFLGRESQLGRGERRYLELLRTTALRLYEVEDVTPGVSVTLREILEGTSVTVSERRGSRSMLKHQLLAARIIEAGPAGKPEIEAGLLDIPNLIRNSVVSQLSLALERFRREHPGADETAFYKAMGPFFHDAWVRCVLDPPVPHIENTDGEDLLLTRVRFDVTEAAGLKAALDQGKDLERAPEGRDEWFWTGSNQKGEPVMLGRIVLGGESLELECNSAERGSRGRAMIEELAAGRVRHRLTSHENVAMAVRDGLRARSDERSGSVSEEETLPRELQEALTLDAYARQYRRWLDEPVPALADHTPREAARDATLRPKLVDLIRGLEGMYQSALKGGAPAYDPSWMWGELGLEEGSQPTHPPPLARERMASLFPGVGELCGTLAEQVRRQPGFDDASTVLTAEYFGRNLEVQRFLRDCKRGADLAALPADSSEVASSDLDLAIHVQFMTNFELHRRKTFWVDESLAYMLAKTDLEVPGSDVRAPFPCFALVFTDRYVLSLAERMLSADRRSPLAGHFLRVATVYVTEERLGENRLLRVGFALDALGADPPHLVVQEIPLSDNVQVSRFLESVGPQVVTDPPVPDAHPLRGLVHITLNAILYATSAGVAPELRRNPGGACRTGSRPEAAPLVFSSEEVFFLPGAIEISRVRTFQELERAPTGRRILYRFMVRGHWRRPAAGWKDQRMRWIEPYWKGPDIAAVIERAYKLKP